MWLLFQNNVHVCIAHHLLIKRDEVACGYCSSIMYAHSIYIYLLKWIRWHYFKKKNKKKQKRSTTVIFGSQSVILNSIESTVIQLMYWVFFWK